MLDKCQKHLSSVHESYFQHLTVALCFGVQMVGAGLAAIVHALCPALFERTASNTIIKLHGEMMARKNTQDPHG